MTLPRTWFASTPDRRLLPLPVLQGIALYWLLLKGITLFASEPHADEAYYWLWGQHVSLSYFDHPGLHAWLQALSATLFGWNLFALRALTVFTTGVTLCLLWAWARRIHREDWRYGFWLAAAVLFASPLMLLYTTIAIQDRLLVVLIMLSVHCFAWAFADRVEGRARVWPFYLAAGLIGLAGLTKYNAALVGLGVFATVLVRRDLRGMLREPHLYLAALLALVIQTPTIWWNAGEGFASFRYHFVDRVAFTGQGGFNLGYTTALLAETLLMISPTLLVPLAGLLTTRAGSGFAGTLHSLAKWIFVVSTLAVLALSTTRYILFYWNIVGYAVAFALAGWFMRSRVVLALHLAYGLVINTLLIVQFAMFPIFQAIGLSQPQSSALFGWSEVARQVEAAEIATGADFATAPTWETASKLAFALRRPDLPALTEGTDAFDFWFDAGAFAGKDAIVLAEPGDESHIPYLRTLFDSVEPIGTVEIERFGRPIFLYRLYLGRNYHAER